MIGGKITRVVRIGPDGMTKDEDGIPVFANTIKLIVQERNSTARCAVHVALCNYEIEIGDTAWWQGGNVYWTKPNSSRHDVKLQKVGFTYSGESLDLPPVAAEQKGAQ